MKFKSPSVVASKKAMKKMFGNPVGELEDIMTDMFGEGGKEEVKEAYTPTNPKTKREEWEKPQWECDLAILMGKLVGWRDAEFDQPLIDFIRSVRTQALEEERERVKSIIQSAGPDLVCPINEPPFREDYIDKWNLLTHLNKK
jgi:hypothetical protein